MARSVLSHDAFSRESLVRTSVPKQFALPCRWCGAQARFSYHYEKDGICGRILRGSESGTFCSVGCFRSYHS